MVSYTINKGINRPVTFKGLQGQYIWWFAGSMIGVMILFVIFFVCGVNSWVCVFIALITGGVLATRIIKRSQQYGLYGLMKARAARRIPTAIRCRSRAVFLRTM
jgi:hypothetical protein